MLKIEKLFLVSVTSLFLSACGGGGGSSGSSTVATSCATSTSSFCTTEFNNNYGLVTTKAYEAFDDGYDGDGVKVAVLDGQFDTSHADLDANIITGYDEEDDNGTVAHVGAYSDNHGTHVAGIIAAERNGTGMMGIAYNASIMPIKIFDDDGDFSGEISNSVAFAADNGATVLNNSWGTATWTSAATCTVGGTAYTCYGLIPGTSSAGFNSTAERTEWDDVATANAVSHLGAFPHFVDISQDNFMSALVTLAAELYMVRDRVHVLEAELEKNNILPSNAVEVHEDTKEEAK